MKELRIFIVLLLALNVSCDKKKYPETVIENEPVFYTKFTLNSKEYVLNGGIDDYRMFATYQQDASGVYNFVAEMKKVSCDGVCPNSLRIQINDYKPRAASEPIEISRALSSGGYDFIMPPQEIGFKSGFNKTAGSYLWNFGDGTTSSEANPVHPFKKEGYYKVSLTITDNNSINPCMNSVSTTVKVGFYNKSCYTGINLNDVKGRQLSFSNSTFGGTAPFQYLWGFGDGSSSTLKDPVHMYSREGSYPITLRVTDANKDTAYAEYNAITQNDLSSCAANFTVASVNNQLTALNQALSQVVVSWTDENGVVYRSNNATQPTHSFFEIASVEDFDNNENNQPTKKLKVRFKCNLYNGGQVMVVDNAEAVICVAYK